MKEKIFKGRNLKTLLSICFAVAMMVVLLPMSGIAVHAEYHQVIGNDGQKITPIISKVQNAIQDGPTLQFIEINGSPCSPPENVDGRYTGDISSALIKKAKGFQYADGKFYDVYIRLTEIKGASRWSAGSGDIISLSPASNQKTSVSYNYEVWLMKEGESDYTDKTKRATFLFVGGSCYMCGEYGRQEYCRPWSTDNNIYITQFKNNDNTQLKYDTTKNGWIPTTDQGFNDRNIVIFGEGVSADHSIKGGYACDTTNNLDHQKWGSEMQFGYVVNGSIVFKDAENNITVSNIPDGQITAYIPETLKSNAPVGKHISGWKASQNVVLNGGKTITAGDIIKNDQLDLILSYGDMTLTVAGYEDHNWTYTNTGDKIEAYCANCPGGYDVNNKLQLTLSASTPNYTGDPVEPEIIYGTQDERTAWVAAGLTLPNPNVSVPSEPGYIEKTYYNADGNGQKIGGDPLTEAPKNVGKYVVDVKVSYGADSVTVSVPYSIKNEADIDDTEVEGGQGKVTVTGMKDDQEYIVSHTELSGPITDSEWNSGLPVGPDGVVTGLEDGQPYYVYTRKKAAGNNPAGEPAPVGSCKTNVARPTNNKTGYTIDGDNKITIQNGYEVFSDENCANPVTSGTSLSPDTTYYVRKAASDDGSPASTPFAFKLGKDVAPTGLGTVPNSGEGTSDGKITGVTPGMTYSTDGGNTWNEVGSTANEITGLSAGSVLVRFGTSSAYTTLWIGAGPSPSYESDGGGHVHEFEWGNWNRVTKDENGTMVYQCKLCGYVLEKEYIPAYAYTCLTESEHVLKTPQNGSVVCEMGRWNAYPRWFFEKLATRPDVNITLKFLYQHKQYTVYIPAGTKIDTELDWYGPLKICSLYKFEVK